MKTKKATSFILLLLINTIKNQYVYTQLPNTINFTSEKPTLKQPLTLPENFKTSKKYSLWGWFKPSLMEPSISNIVTLRNEKKNNFEKKKIDENNFDETDFEELEKNLDNNNMGDDLLFVNYDLGEIDIDTNKQLYSLIFIIKNSQEEMAIEGFVGIENSESWNYFGISVDYEIGVVSIYFKVFDQLTPSQEKSFTIDFPEFELKKNSELFFAAFENNPFFDSASGFLGDISHFEFGLFYTQNLPILWMGYMNKNIESYNSILIDLKFDVYKKNEKVKSYGEIDSVFKIEKFTPLFLKDKNKIGIQIYSNSLISLEEIDTKNSSDFIKSISFLFNFKFEEDLPINFPLLIRGKPNQNGYLKISLDIFESGRILSMTLIGKNEKLTSWIGLTKFVPNKIYNIIIGVSQSKGNSLRSIYTDNTGKSDFGIISDDFEFSFLPNNIQIFSSNAEKKKENAGFFDFYRFMIFNSGSNAVNFFNVYTNPDLKKELFKNINEKNCTIRTSYYEKEKCIFCNNSIVDKNNNCIEHCPFGEKNGLNNVCVKCKEKDCSEIESTKFELKKINSETWNIEPTRKIITKNIDYKNIFDLNQKDNLSKKDPFTYEIDYNKDLDEIDLSVDYNKYLRDDNLELSYLKNNIYDKNRNLIYEKKTYHKLDRVCYVSESRKTSLKILAYFLLIFFVITFLFLLIFTILYKKSKDYLSLWKYFLFLFTKLQLVSLFLLLGIYMPCCIKAFLQELYTYSISWNHGLRLWIDDIYKDSVEYNRHSPSTNLSLLFQKNSVRYFFLHNIGIFFIVHLLVFFIFCGVKLWDFYKSALSKTFLYKLLILMEYTVLIFCYVIVDYQIFVFAGLNWTNFKYNHSNYIFSFVLTLFYVFVFVCFWFYAAWRLLGKSNYFEYPTSFNKFYFFFVGYRQGKSVRTYDLWRYGIHLALGLFIGTLTLHPLTQMFLIFGFFILFGVFTIVLRPWKYKILLFSEMFTMLMIFGVIIIFLIFQLFDHGGCLECGDREGFLCILVIIFIFLALFVGLVALIVQTLFITFRKWDPVKMRKKLGYLGELDAEDIKELNEMEVKKENPTLPKSFKEFKVMENTKRKALKDLECQGIIKNSVRDNRYLEVNVMEIVDIGSNTIEPKKLGDSIKIFNESTKDLKSKEDIYSEMKLRPDSIDDKTIQIEALQEEKKEKFLNEKITSFEKTINLNDNSSNVFLNSKKDFIKKQLDNFEDNNISPIYSREYKKSELYSRENLADKLWSTEQSQINFFKKKND